MNLREMILEVRSALDEPSESARMWTDTEIKRWLNQAARIMVSTSLPLQAVYKTPTVASQQEYALPDEVIKVFSVTYFQGRNYQLRPADNVGIQSGVLVTGTPSSFYLRQRSRNTAGLTTTTVDVQPVDANNPRKAAMVIGLDPAPSGVGSLIVSYYSRSMVLVNDGDEISIPEEFHDGICAYAIAKGKEKDLAYEEGQLYLARFKDHTEGLRALMILDGQTMAFPHVTIPDEDEYVSDMLMDSRFVLPS